MGNLGVTFLKLHGQRRALKYMYLFRKRWGGGGGTIHNLLVVVGGRGKRAGQAELYSQVQTKRKIIF